MALTAPRSRPRALAPRPAVRAVSASALSAGALSGGDGGGSAAAASAAALLPSEALQWLHLAASLAAFALADQAFMRLAAATGAGG